MANFLSPGTKITVQRKGPVAQPGIATATGGFEGITQKGAPHTPVEVFSLADYEAQFGARIGDYPEVYDALTAFFVNGGASAFINRITASTILSASRTISTQGGATSGSLSSDPGAFPVALAVGDTFLGKVNGGGAVTKTVAATNATVTGAAATYAAVGGGAAVGMVIQINGIPGNQSITFQGTEASQLDYLQAINSQLRGAAAVDDGGEIMIETDIYGSDAGGSIVSVAAAYRVALGFGAGPIALVNVGPNSAANVDAVTAAEAAVLLSYSGATTVDNGDGSITITSNTTGTGSSFQFSSGTGVSKITGFDTSVHSGTTTGALTTMVATASSPGAWGNATKIQATRNDTSVTTVNVTSAGSTSTINVANAGRIFVGDTLSITQGLDTQRGVVASLNGNAVTFASAITVPGGGYAGTEPVVNETFNLAVYDASGNLLVNFGPSIGGLRMAATAAQRYFVNVINAYPRTPITVSDSLALAAADPRPSADLAPVAMSGAAATDPVPVANDYIGSQGAKTGWWAFDKAPTVNFISCPGITDVLGTTNGKNVQIGMQTYVQLRGDVQAIFEGPQGAPATGGGSILEYVNDVGNFVGEQLAVYWPWVKAIDPVTGLTVSQPPSGYVQGIIARTHARRNFGKAPAGIVDGQVLGIVGLDTELTEGAPEYDAIYPSGINAILKFSGTGYAVFGSRTLDATGEFGQVNVVTVFNVAKRVTKGDTRWMNFENNNPDTREMGTQTMESRFRDWRVNGILAGAKDSEAFYIIDETSALDVENFKFKYRIGLATQNPGEFLDFTLERDTRAVDAALAGA